MAALDFPSSPSLGQSYAGYTWDGEKWTSGTGYGAIYISDTPPAAPVGSLWWESDTSIIYVRYNDGSSIQWCAIAGGPVDSVRYDTVQTLTETQKTQGRSNIYAAPFDAIGWSGMQVNGATEISQERGGTPFVVSNNTATYGQDGWVVRYNAAATLAIVCYPNYGAGPVNPGFSSCLGVQAQTGLASLAAGDYVTATNMIEGIRTSRLGYGLGAPQPVLIGFWVNSTIPGTMAVTLQNATPNRSYITDVVINAANTWEYKTLTVPGDTGGTWDRGTGTGLRVVFCFGSGATARGAPSTWLATNSFATASTTNLVATTSNVIFITGLIVLPGLEAPSAARSPLILRPLDQELVMCQRYYQKQNLSLDITANAGSVAQHTIQCSPIMRAAPTVTVGTPYFAPANIGTPTPTGAGTAQPWAVPMQALITATGRGYHYAYVVLDARL